MMKKMRHNARIAIMTLLLGGMVLISGKELSGQQDEDISPPTSLSTDQPSEGWLTSFDLENCNFASTGENSYFILRPGFQVTLEGEEDGEKLQLIMTVLDETKVVDGVETRVLEEKESKAGNLVEVSRNYFAICKPTNDAFYFGEDVDIYKDGEILSHEGSLAGWSKRC